MLEDQQSQKDGFESNIYDKKKLKQLGMNALLGVMGSVRLLSCCNGME